MPIITLITDLGTSDWYVGALKGALISSVPEAQVVDITHDINKFDVQRAGFMLRNVFREFPEGTIHLVSVAASPEIDKLYIAVKFRNQYFIGTDNGIFSLAFDGEEPEFISDLSVVIPDMLKSSFQAKDIFLQVVKAMANGMTIQELGRQKSELFMMTQFAPWVGDNAIKGCVIYNDKFGNAVTNISKQLFVEKVGSRKFTIMFWKNTYAIHSISRIYTAVKQGKEVAFFNSVGLLEIAINQGSAKDLLGLRINEPITIEIL
jgi:S-adenosylmethionine hydrolase